MASKKGIQISGHYVVSTKVLPFHVYTLSSKKLKDRTESYFIMFLKLNDHPTRCFNFLRLSLTFSALVANPKNCFKRGPIPLVVC